MSSASLSEIITNFPPFAAGGSIEKSKLWNGGGTRMNERERRTSKEEERTRLHHPPFPKQRQLGQNGKVKPGMEWRWRTDVVKQPIISHLLLIPLPPSGVTIATEGGRKPPPTADANTAADVSDARADGNIMVTRVVRGRVLHNNELGSPEFRVALIQCLGSIIIGKQRNISTDMTTTTRLDHSRPTLMYSRREMWNMPRS